MIDDCRDNNLSQPIRVKFISTSIQDKLWKRQFPNNNPVWGHCIFFFELDESNYDWLVVYNDLPRLPGYVEKLKCHSSDTMLITTEPSSIKAYGSHFLSQFGHVLTSQPEWALSHQGRIFSQPALHWFYGLGRDRIISYDTLNSSPPLNKTKQLSTVCSSKRQRHTLHNKRYNFTQELKKRIPALDIYGHGVKAMDDKAESLDDYRYHIAIENYIGEHHWTEKLSDAFLGCTLPFYCGCPNAADYFPEESFIPINLNDVDGATEVILKAVRDGEYERRLPYILEARKRVLEQYNIFSVLSREIEARGVMSEPRSGDGTILSRHLLRKRHPAVALHDLYEKCRLRILHTLRP